MEGCKDVSFLWSSLDHFLDFTIPLLLMGESYGTEETKKRKKQMCFPVSNANQISQLL